MSVRADLEHSLRAMLSRCGDDELRVLHRVAERLLAAKPQYGELVLATDKRDFRAEAADEAADLIFYVAATEVAASLKRTALTSASDEWPSAIDFDGEPSR